MNYSDKNSNISFLIEELYLFNMNNSNERESQLVYEVQQPLTLEQK